MDYGLYILKAYDTLTGSPEVNVTFILESNPIPGLLSQASIAGICIGALLIFTLVAIFMTYNAIYIRVYWKRCFGGYVTGKKRYTWRSSQGQTVFINIIYFQMTRNTEQCSRIISPA